ncbi:MAG: hypothetical protein AAF975_08695, partial [Spirochaetota bacterium]
MNEMEYLKKETITPPSRFTSNLILFFWIVSGGFFLTHGLSKYFIILAVWGSNDGANFMSHFLLHNISIGLILLIIHSI